MSEEPTQEVELKPKYFLIKHTKYIKANRIYSLILRKPFINEEIIKHIKNNVIKEIIGDMETLLLYKDISVRKTFVKTPSLTWSNYCFKKFPRQPENIVCVTGTNGKTSTCWYISQILTHLNVPNILINTIGIYENCKKINNNSNSTPDAEIIHFYLNKFAKKQQGGFAIIETTSIGIEEYRIHNLHPQIAILTNCTIDHMDYHKTFENYLRAKLKLGKYSKKFLVHESVTQNIFPKYGHEFLKMEIINNSSIYTYNIDNQVYEVQTNLMGKFNGQNVLSAITVLKEFININDIIDSIKYLKPAEGRLNVYENIVIDYAHTLDGVDQIFQTVKQYNFKKIITVIGFGGNSSDIRLNQISEYLKKNSDIIILTTDNPRTQDPMEIVLKSKKICKKAVIELNREKAIEKAYEMAEKQDVILVLGKGHEQYMEYKEGRTPYSEKEVVLKILKKLT